MNLSAIILTRNEEENIANCIKSLKFVDEIIIVDDFSSDNTVSLAKELGAKVFRRELNNNFAEQRNFGVKMAKGKWIVLVDADEIVGKALKDEIIQTINNPLEQKQGYFLKRQDLLWGKKMRFGEQGNMKLLRLAKKGKGEWRRRVHEVWEVGGEKRTLKNPLIHYPHKILNDFIKKVNYWSTLHAIANKEEKKRSSLVKIIFFPLFKLINNLFIRRGILDNERGFMAALMMSFHSFLSWSKLWLDNEKDS